MLDKSINNFNISTRKALIKTTHICNNNCFFCHSKYNKKDLTLNEIKDKILILKNDNSKIETIVLSGGEVTIRADFFEILDFIVENNFKIGLLTNAKMFAISSFYEKFEKYKYNIDYLFVSLHGKNAYIHDSITRSKNSFLLTIRGIKNLLKINSNLLVNVVVSKFNINSFYDICKIMNSIGVKRIKFSVLEPVVEKDKQYIINLDCVAGEIKRVVVKAKNDFKDLNIYWDGLPLCFMRGFEDYQLSLYIENFILASYNTEDNFFKVDFGNKEKIDLCKNCQKQDECEGIYSKYLKYCKVVTDKDDLREDVVRYLSCDMDKVIKIDDIDDENSKNNNQTLRLFIFTTNNCNLACKYCFVSKGNNIIEYDNLKLSLDYLLNSGYHNLELHFFGGEPLLLKSELYEFCFNYLEENCNKLNKKYKIFITTNGVRLKEDYIEVFAKRLDKVSLELSIDGDKVSQDKNRVFLSGDGSYEVILPNLRNALNNGIYIKASFVVSPETVNDFFNNIGHLINLGLKNIWIMPATGMIWRKDEVKIYLSQFEQIFEKYFDEIVNGDIRIFNLFDYSEKFEIIAEQIIDYKGDIFPGFVSYLKTNGDFDKKYILGNLKDNIKDIDFIQSNYIDKIINNEVMELFFFQNDISQIYDNNSKLCTQTHIVLQKFKDKIKSIVDFLEFHEKFYK